MAGENINPSHDQLKKLECPFTWITKDITKEDDKEYHLSDDEESFPLLRLMKCIMTVYVDTKAKTKSDEILNGLKKCTEIMATLKENEHPEISTDVVQYVLQSTKCFVYEQLNLPERLRQIFSTIKQDWKMNNKERSTLIACRSICWSKYHRIGTSEAEVFIRDAIKENPNCELWYFILGKNLRRIRRNSMIGHPTEDEISNFKKAYEMSANPVFGIFLAQMYREAKMMKEATSMYYKIYEKNPAGITVLLRLALGFIGLKDFPKAKECLDKIEALSPNHSMYLHYRGSYHMKLKNYQEAAKFLKEASKDYYNFPAEIQYLDCAVKLDGSFDTIEYLEDMVEKYSRLPITNSQSLFLHLALAYWLKKCDVPNSLKYFRMAVEINPDDKCISNYISPQALWIHEKNLYQLLNRDILPIVNNNKKQFEQSCIDDAEKLEEHCKEYFAKNFSKTLHSFSKFK